MRSREIRCLQALNRQQPLSTRQISAAAGLAYNTASKALYSMARRRCVTWARVLVAKGRPEKLYWLDDRMNPKIPDDEYLQAVGDEWTSAAGVADTIGRSVSAAKRRLAQLHEEGRLERMKSDEQTVGRKAWLYRRPQMKITGKLVQMGGEDAPGLQIECDDGAIVDVANVPKALLAAMPPLLYKRVTLTLTVEAAE